MNIIVFGAAGMLGRAVVEAAEAAGHRAIAHTHRTCNIAHPGSVYKAMDPITADAAINCAGVLTQADATTMVKANALGPHVLAAEAARQELPLIHVSTDCVFARAAGDGGLTVHDIPCPQDLYGRSKLLGEAASPWVTNVRTSFVGLQHGLLRWFLDTARSGQTIPAWRNAFWTGSTVYVVARALVEMATARPLLGVTHLATVRKWSKAQVLAALNEGFGLNAALDYQDEPRIDRALAWTHPMPGLDNPAVMTELVERTAKYESER